MEQQTYFKSVYRRTNFKLGLYALFFRLSSAPRLLMEVFIRRNMGTRYFSFGVCVILFIFSLGFLTLSIVAPRGISDVVQYGGYSIGAFGLYFMIFANQRRKESRMDSFSIDFEKFSLSSGELTGWFKSKVENGTPLHKVEIIYEPLPFFVIGLALSLIPYTMALGIILVISSAIYSLSYLGAYTISRDYFMDIIDEKITGEEMGNALKEGFEEPSESGFKNRAPLPSTKEHRAELYDLYAKKNGFQESTSIAQ